MPSHTCCSTNTNASVTSHASAIQTHNTNKPIGVDCADVGMCLLTQTAYKLHLFILYDMVQIIKNGSGWTRNKVYFAFICLGKLLNVKTVHNFPQLYWYFSLTNSSGQSRS